MAEAGLFFGWGQIVRGREAKSLVVFNDAMAFWGGQQASGAIESFDVVLLGPHGGDLAGFFLVHGSQAQMDAVRANEDFQRLTARANMVVDGLGIIDAITGDGLGQAIEGFQEVINELG